MMLQHLTQLVMLINLSVLLQLLLRPASIVFSAILLGIFGFFSSTMLIITVFIR